MEHKNLMIHETCTQHTNPLTEKLNYNIQYCDFWQNIFLSMRKDKP